MPAETPPLSTLTDPTHLMLPTHPNMPILPALPSLLLDKRQRAMLKDMGIRVWLPLPKADTSADTSAPASAAAPVAASVLSSAPSVVSAIPAAQPTPAVNAPEKVASEAVPALITRQSDPINEEMTAEIAPARLSSLSSASSSSSASNATWQFAAAHALYASAPPGAGGPRWLVLAETDAAAVQRTDFHPFDGDAGKLLDNMLRATRLAEPGRVLLVPMCCQRPTDTAGGTGSADGAQAANAPTPTAALGALIAAHQPHLLLIMGRLAGQALLQSTEPLGKLRGRVHMVQGVKTIVTYDAQPLLRTPADKAKAWDDLCLGIAQAAAVFKPA